MKPLELVYLLRLVTGVLAAVLCIGYVVLVRGTPIKILSSDDFLYSISIAIVVYLFSYYIFKARFKDKVTKIQKLMTTGIGIYFLAWVALYVLLYTLLFA